MTEFLTPTSLRSLAEKHGVNPSKALSQNFVIDPNTIRRIIRLAELSKTDKVLELGAGLGSLTVALAEACDSVVAVELDHRLVAALSEVLGELDHVEIIQGDALQLDLAELLRGDSWRMVSNLPYKIATPLVAKLLTDGPTIEDFVFTVQREVGERLVAKPGSKSYGAVSVLVAYYCSSESLGKVPPTVFWPRPSVESVLIRLTRRPPSVEVEFEALMKVVRDAFSQRRKRIRNSLASAWETTAIEVEGSLEKAGVDYQARAEELSLSDFAAIAEVRVS